MTDALMAQLEILEAALISAFFLSPGDVSGLQQGLPSAPPVAAA